MSAGTIAIVIGSAAAIWLLLRRRHTLRWIAASLPFWVVANDSDAMMACALFLTIGGMAIGAVGPTLVGRRRRRDAASIAALASGPLIPIEPRTYVIGKHSRLLSIATMVTAFVGLIMLTLSGAGIARDVTLALAISSAIIAITFAFSNWFAGRVQLRVDAEGVHSRVMFEPHTIPWPEIAGLTLRYLFMPGFGIRIVYYVVYSPAREISFPSSTKGAEELRATIESATGLRFPEPEIEPNF